MAEIAMWIAAGWTAALLTVCTARCVGAIRRDRREDKARCRLLALAARGHHVEGYGLGERLPDEGTTDQEGGW
jgi:hypothetical protein